MRLMQNATKKFRGRNDVYICIFHKEMKKYGLRRQDYNLYDGRYTILLATVVHVGNCGKINVVL